MFSNCQLSGMDLGFPDVCKTPIPPIPYPNMAMSQATVPVAYNILLKGVPQHNMMSFRPVTQGDTAGVGLGVVSQTVMAQQRHVTGAFTYIIKGSPATRVTSMGPTNRINCPVSARIVPSQFTELVLAA